MYSSCRLLLPILADVRVVHNSAFGSMRPRPRYLSVDKEASLRHPCCKNTPNLWQPSLDT